MRVLCGGGAYEHVHEQTGDVRRIRNFRELVVWQKSMDLARVCCFELARSFPSGPEAFSEQFQRTALSIPSNIAEGHELSTRVLPAACARRARLGRRALYAAGARRQPCPHLPETHRGRAPERRGRDRAHAPLYLLAALRRRAEAEKLAATRKTAPTLPSHGWAVAPVGPWPYGPVCPLWPATPSDPCSLVLAPWPHPPSPSPLRIPASPLPVGSPLPLGPWASPTEYRMTSCRSPTMSS
jgi:hypothetical protein